MLEIPAGVNAIGIYEYNASAAGTLADPKCTNTLYPTDRTAPIPVLFAPHRNLPVIQW